MERREFIGGMAAIAVATAAKGLKQPEDHVEEPTDYLLVKAGLPHHVHYVVTRGLETHNGLTAYRHRYFCDGIEANAERISDMGESSRVVFSDLRNMLGRSDEGGAIEVWHDPLLNEYQGLRFWWERT